DPRRAAAGGDGATRALIGPIAAGAVALAAIASFHHNLAIDEPFTALAIAHPASLGATLVHDNVPLFYALLLPWTRVFGTSAFALRALSVWASAAAFLSGAPGAPGPVPPKPRNGGSALTAILVGSSVTYGLQPAATVRPYALLMLFAAM